MALSVHALAFVLSARPLIGGRTAPDDGQVTAIDIEPSTETALEREATDDARLLPGATGRAPARDERMAVAALDTSRTAAAGATPGEEMPTDSDAGATSPAPGGLGTLELAGPTGLAGLSNDALGLGTRNVLMGSFLDGGAAGGRDRGGGDEGVNVAPGIQASLRDALHDQDVAMGLGSGGPLIGPAEEATRTSDTPWDSNATFEVSADANGQITAVRVVSVSEGWGLWERVAGNILAALQTQKLRVPAHGKGMIVLLQVASKRALPSGASPRYQARALARDPAPAPNASAGPSTVAANGPPHVEILKLNPKVEDANPKDDSAVNMRIPDQRANGTDIVAVPFDVSDIGARPARSVHARVLREKVL